MTLFAFGVCCNILEIRAFICSVDNLQYLSIYLLWIMWMIYTQVQILKVEDILLSVQDDGDSGSELVTFLRADFPCKRKGSN